MSQETRMRGTESTNLNKRKIFSRRKSSKNCVFFRRNNKNTRRFNENCQNKPKEISRRMVDNDYKTKMSKEMNDSSSKSITQLQISRKHSATGTSRRSEFISKFQKNYSSSGDIQKSQILTHNLQNQSVDIPRKEENILMNKEDEIYERLEKNN